MPEYDDEEAGFRPDRLLNWCRDRAQEAGKWSAEVWRQVSPEALWNQVGPVVERFLQDPVVLAAIEAPRLTTAARLRQCHCLCQAVHPAQPDVCERDAAVTTRRFVDVDVPLCSGCASAFTAAAS
jgi:hypothetical protein